MEIVKHPFFHGKELESSNWNNRPLTRGCLGSQVGVSSTAPPGVLTHSHGPANKGSKGGSDPWRGDGQVCQILVPTSTSGSLWMELSDKGKPLQLSTLQPTPALKKRPYFWGRVRLGWLTGHDFLPQNRGGFSNLFFCLGKWSNSNIFKLQQGFVFCWIGGDCPHPIPKPAVPFMKLQQWVVLTLGGHSKLRRCPGGRWVLRALLLQLLGSSWSRHWWLTLEVPP